MSNFFSDAMSDLDSLEQDVLGPNYKYWKQVMTPAELGMSKDGNLGALANDATAMIKYTKFLIEGGGASAVDGPIGDRFFLRTGARCTDIASGKPVTRSLYVDNIPSGKIPFVSQALGENFTELQGLLPGTIFGLANINPLAIFQAFMTGTNPSCQAITLPVRDVNNVNSVQTEFMINSDIRNVSPCLFTTLVNPISKASIENCNTNNKGYLGVAVNDPKGGDSSVPTPPTKQCTIKSGFPPKLKTACSALKDSAVCEQTGFCKWGETESFQNRYSTQSYIGDCSEIISYLYIGLLILLVCCILIKAAKSKR